MMKLTNRELSLMERAYQAGDDNGVCNEVNKGRRYTFQEWLAVEVVVPTNPGAPGYRMTREEFLVANTAEDASGKGVGDATD